MVEQLLLPQLTVVSVRTGRRVAALAVGGEPHHFTIGRYLWASDNSEGMLLRIDPSSHRVLGRTPVGPAPHHSTRAGEQLLVAVHDRGEVAVVTTGDRVVQRVRVSAGPHGIAAVPATSSRVAGNVGRSARGHQSGLEPIVDLAGDRLWLVAIWDHDLPPAS